jgi:hypothetical protein
MVGVDPPRQPSSNTLQILAVEVRPRAR